MRRGEMPMKGGGGFIRWRLPSGHFLVERGLVGNRPVQAWAAQEAKVDFGQVEPGAEFGGGVAFQFFGQTASLSRRTGCLERGQVMGSEMIPDQADLVVR